MSSYPKMWSYPSNVRVIPFHLLCFEGPDGSCCHGCTMWQNLRVRMGAQEDRRRYKGT